MADGDLIQAGDIAGFPGAPFAANVLTGAGDAIRAECGWHIAPARTETLTVEAESSKHLFLPTLALTAVTEIRDVSFDVPQVVTGYRFKANGIITRTFGVSCFVVGHTYEVDVTHGLDAVPFDLLKAASIIARSANGERVTQSKQLGPGQVTYADLSTGTDLGSPLDPYRLLTV